MEPFRKIAAVAAPMMLDNVDTDSLIPVSHMKDMNADYGRSLFADLRFRADGSESPEFILNRPEYRGSGILIAGDNFGCGSSREHAVWALLGYGIRCVIAGSYGEIFYANAFRMGLLPVVLPEKQRNALGADVAADGGRNPTGVDLEAQLVTSPSGARYPFEIDASKKRVLLEGLDAVGATLLHADEIARFQRTDRAKRPWVYAVDLVKGTM